MRRRRRNPSTLVVCGASALAGAVLGYGVCRLMRPTGAPAAAAAAFNARFPGQESNPAIALVREPYMTAFVDGWRAAGGG